PTFRQLDLSTVIQLGNLLKDLPHVGSGRDDNFDPFQRLENAIQCGQADDLHSRVQNARNSSPMPFGIGDLHPFGSRAESYPTSCCRRESFRNECHSTSPAQQALGDLGCRPSYGGGCHIPTVTENADEYARSRWWEEEGR